MGIDFCKTTWKHFQRALPTETKVESGTSQSKSATSIKLSNSGERAAGVDLLDEDSPLLQACPPPTAPVGEPDPEIVQNAVHIPPPKNCS